MRGKWWRGDGSSGAVLAAVRWSAWAVLMAFCLYFLYRNRNMQLDDALIYARYIDNAISGNGLVYNEGVRFNGLTSPLYSYLVLALAVLVGDALLASFLVSAVCYAAAAWVMAAIFRQAASEKGWQFAELVGWCGAAIFIFIPYFYFFVGMETALLTLLSGLLVLLMRRRSYTAAGICAALLFLTRSEAVVLVLVVALHDLWSHRRLPPFRIGTYVVPPILVGTVFAVNYLYYGHILPQTGMAKVWQGQSGLWAGAEFLRFEYLHDWVLRSNETVLVLLLAAACAGFIALGGTYLNRVVVPFLVLFGAFYVLLSIPNYGWYYAPFVAFASFYSGAGFALVLVAAGRLLGGGWKVVGVAASVGLLVFVLKFMAEISRIERGAFDPYLDIGLWLQDNTEATDSIAMVEIGTIGYYSKRTIVDILGLVNPDNARFIGERRFDAWLDRYQPEYVLVHEPVWGHEVSVYSAGARWSLHEDCRFEFPGYRLYRFDRTGRPGLHTCDPAQAHHRGQIVSDPLASTPAGSAGHVDLALVVGNFVLLHGWARDGDLPYRELAYHGDGAESMLWQRTSRPDVSAALELASMEASGFRVAVRFPDHEQALRTVGLGCLLVLPGAVDDQATATACLQPPSEVIRPPVPASG